MPAGDAIAGFLAGFNESVMPALQRATLQRQQARLKLGDKLIKMAGDDPEILQTEEFQKQIKSIYGSDGKDILEIISQHAQSPVNQAVSQAKKAVFGPADAENPAAITDTLKGLGITSTGGMMARAPEAAEASAAVPTMKVPLGKLPPEQAANVLRKRFATESGPMVSLATGNTAMGAQSQAERKMVTGTEQFDQKLAMDVYKTQNRIALADKKLALSERRLGIADERLALDAMKANRPRTVFKTVKDGDTEKVMAFEFGPDGKQLSETVKFTAPRQLPRLKSPMPITTQTLAINRALQSRGYSEEQARDLIESRSIPKWAIEKATKSIKTDTKAWKDRVARQYDNVVKRRLGKTPQFPDDPVLSEWDEGALQKVAQGSVSDMAALLNFAMGIPAGGAAPAAEAAPTVNPPISGPYKLPGGATFEPLR